MFFSSWLRNRKSSRGPRCQGPRCRPRLEALEDRWLPSTLTVTSPLDDGSSGTLRATIAAAGSGDTIVFDSSLNGKTITLNGNELLLNKNLTIQGPGATNLAISANHLSRVFEVAANTQVTLDDLTIRDGSGSGLYDGGGLFNQGTATVNGCTFSGNSAEYGGGICNHTVWATLTVTNSVFSGNTANTGGGGIDNDSGTATVSACTIGGFGSGNSAWVGGGIDNGGTLTVSGCTLSYNKTEYGDGGGILDQGYLTVTDCTLSHNSAVIDGGGLYSEGNNTQLQRTTLSDNSAGRNGGGIGSGFTMSLSGCTVGVVGHGNTAGGNGGGIWSQNTLTITRDPISGNSAISYNSAANGGGIYHNAGWLTVSFATVSNNVASVSGGGVFNAAFMSSISDCTLSGNSAANGGGICSVPIYASSSLTVSGCTISGNSANIGGGIYNAYVNKSTLTVSGGNISGNTATTKGGGLYNNGNATIQSTTITKNSAGAQGGGIFNDVSGTLTLYFSSVVSGNLAPDGADLCNLGRVLRKKG
jgi:hypothetical protein